jgi:hypothetical protein
MGDDVMHLAGAPGPFGREIEQRLLVAFAFSTLAAVTVTVSSMRVCIRSPDRSHRRTASTAPNPSASAASQLIRAGECSNIAYSAIRSATSATSLVPVTHWISATAARNQNVAAGQRWRQTSGTASRTLNTIAAARGARADALRCAS